MAEQSPIKGRTAIVTGASRGIGRAIAISLGEAGFNVVLNYHANRQAAEEAADQIRQAGGQAAIVQADIGRLEEHDPLLDAAIAGFGSVDLLVNNAGVAPKVRADMLQMNAESYDHVLDTNLRGPFFLTQRVARRMMDLGPVADGQPARAIVNISSISAYTASVNRAEYCLAKAGIAMMTSLFATRLAEHGILVYEIRPGIIATDMTGPVKAKYDQLILEDGLLPIRRWGQPRDIAQAVLAIARGLLPYSTGQVLDVDGGFHLRRL
jgi:3-oxoacyl-[acyl-carrier protein] reductase